MSNVSRWNLTEWPTWQFVSAVTAVSVVGYATKAAMLWALLN